MAGTQASAGTAGASPETRANRPAGAGSEAPAKAGTAGGSAPAQSDAAGGPAASGGGAAGESQTAAGAAAAAGSGGSEAVAAGAAGTALATAGRADPAAGSGGSGAASGAAGSDVAGAPAPADIATFAEPIDEASYLFDAAQLRTYDIQIAQSDLDSINLHPSAEAWVPAMLKFEGQTYGPFKVRYKGSVGSFVYPCTMGPPGGPKAGKCAIKLGFNEVDPEARFFGLKKLNLHPMNKDSSQLRERLGYAMFRGMGIAAPRAVHARVLINGEPEGLFSVVENIDGRFTRAHFSEGKGNLYKEIWPTTEDPEQYRKALETNEDEQPSVQRMLDFKHAIDMSAMATANVVDRDYILRFLAVDRVSVNDDGIFRFTCDPTAHGNNLGLWANHNYFWYEAESVTRFWLIPWDLNHPFNGSAWTHIQQPWTTSAACECSTNPDVDSQVPASCDPLIKHFISWLPDYEKRVDDFIAGPFAKARVDALLDAWITQIQPAVVEFAGLKYAPSETAWADGVMKLKANIDSQREHRGYAY